MCFIYRGKEIKRISKNIKCSRGQALVEFAIVFPVYMFFLMCFVQLIMVIHAKFVVDYAVFCAARAGIVNKGDSSYMKKAAAVALSPLYKRTSNILNVTLGYAQAYFDIGDKSDTSKPFRLYLTNDPSPLDRYDAVNSTFQLTQDEKVLKVKLEYDYPMTIPIANRIIRGLFAGFINDKVTLDPDWYQANESGTSNPTLPLWSVCALRLTTLTTPE